MKHKSIFFIRLFFLTAFLIIGQGLISSPPVFAQPAAEEQHKIVIYLFWGEGCSHCTAAKPFLNELTHHNANIELRAYEVFNVPENQELFKKMTAAYGAEPHGVPTIFIGDQYWKGYNNIIQQEIEAAVKHCEEKECPDRGIGIIPGVMRQQSVTQVVSSNPLVQPSLAASLKICSIEETSCPDPEIIANSNSKDTQPENQVASPNQPVQQSLSDSIDLPFLGPIHLATQSIWMSTALISFVDGVNPCSVWVLTMLLAITLHTGSRKKVLIIGLIFLTVTAGIYGLFIAGLFTVFTVVNFVGWIQVVVALVALFFALVNIKDYFWYKEGISFTISDSKKPGIYQRMRKLIDASQSFWGLASATVVMAAGVSLVEFSCTAGFPVLWTNLLVSQKVTGLTFILLLLLYLFIYQLDELAIFFTAVYSLRSSKLEEKHGRLLKLIGGMLMLTLAVVMLVNPALMNNLSSSLIIFGAAFLATLFLLFIHRIILPKFGIWIGTEMEGNNSPKGQ